VPTCTTTGTAPAESPLGITALTCVTPATAPGAPPENCTVAFFPPIVTNTDCTGSGIGFPALPSPLGLPSTPGGAVCPEPVIYRVTTSPALAGCPASLTVLPLFNAAAGPVPELLAVNTPGTVTAIFAAIGGAACPWFTTMI